jgi:glycosyltransferase involved in cell wall biosynthesis
LELVHRLRKDPFEWLVHSSVHPPNTLRFQNEMVRGMVSAIIPGYKGRKYLRRCFESVWAQEPGPFSLEIVFCDDGCPEQTRQLAAELATHSDVPVTIVEHPGSSNRGVGPARNLAMAHSSGEFLALLDADDEWLPPKSRLQVAYFQKQSEVEALCAYANCVDLENEPVIGWSGNRLAGYFGCAVPSHTFEALLDSDPIINSTVMMRRTAVERCGGYTEVMAHQAEDWLLFQKLALNEPIHVIPHVVSNYRVHPTSYTSRYVKEGYDAGVRWEAHLQLLHWLLQDARSREVARKVYRQYTPRLLVLYAAKFRILENEIRLKGQLAKFPVKKGPGRLCSALQSIRKWLVREAATRAVVPEGRLD